MAKKERPKDEDESYWIQPAEGVSFVRRDLTEKQLASAIKEIEEGVPMDVVVSKYAEKIRSGR